MAVAATDLEHLLAQIGADQAGADATMVFVQPGEPLRAARSAVEFAPSAYRAELIGYVEGAGTQLARSRTALRALWHEDGRTDAGSFDEIAARLLRCREALQTLAHAQLNRTGRQTP